MTHNDYSQKIKMNKHIYINNKQIEYFSKHRTSFLFKKEHLSFFERLQQMVYNSYRQDELEFYVVDGDNLDLVDYKGVKIYTNVARFENFFEVKFLDTTITKADKSHYRDILLGTLIDSDE